MHFARALRGFARGGRALLIGLALVSAGVTGVHAAVPADFTLKAVGADKEFKLSETKGKFVALHFLLKTECPICIRHTNDYFLRADEVPGVEHVFIKPDDEGDITKWARSLEAATSAGLVIYRDPDAALAGQAGIPGGYKFHGEEVHYPALIILDGDGKEVFRHVGKSNADRYKFDDFKAKMGELRP